MSHHVRRLLQLAAGITVGLLVTSLLLLQSSRPGEPPTLGADIEMVDMTGKSVTLAEYRGGWTLLFFGFTHCPDVCPVTLQRISAGLEVLDGRDDMSLQAITVAMVTVDPARDSPYALAEYLAPFGPRFVGLAASPANLETLMVAYDVVSNRPVDDTSHHAMDPNETDILHTARIHVLDPSGRLVGEIPPWPLAKDMADALASITAGPTEP